MLFMQESRFKKDSYLSISEIRKNKSIRTMMRLKWTFWDILKHFGIFWDNSEFILTSLERLDPRNHGPTDRHSYRDAWTHLKISTKKSREDRRGDEPLL